MTAFTKANYPLGDVRWDEPKPTRENVCWLCNNQFKSPAEGMAHETDGVGTCNDCGNKYFNTEESKAKAKDLKEHLGILLEGESEQVFPMEFAPNFRGHDDIRTGEMMAFDEAWALMKSIDDDSNDDEFIDNDRFNNPVARGVKEILGIFGLDDNLECFGCGFTGDTGDFIGWHGGRGRKCPNCNSYSVHDPEGPAVGDNYKHKDETPKEETARRNEYYAKIHRENEERKKREGGQ